MSEINIVGSKGEVVMNGVILVYLFLGFLPQLLSCRCGAQVWDKVHLLSIGISMVDTAEAQDGDSTCSRKFANLK